ncbi:MAG: trigger factor, partial [Minisyncoccia bacterium]
MKYSIEKLLNSKIKIKGFLDKDEFQKYIETILDELKNTSQIPGFRKGQIPENILIEKIGKENILQNAAQEAVEDLYFKAIKEDNLEVVSKPQIRILKLAEGNPFEFEIEVEILPKIELPDYKKIAKEIKKEEVFVSDEEIKETIGWILKSRAQFEDLKREAQKGDFVEIEYSCLDIENGKTFHDAFYLGQGHFVEGFEDQLLGMNPGQEKEFTILKEKIKNPNLPQKDLIFKVKLNKVQKVNIPDLTDDFVKTLGNFNNIDDLKKNIREGLELEKENALKEKWRGEFFKNLKEKVEISLPEGLVEYQKEKLFEDLKERVKE